MFYTKLLYPIAIVFLVACSNTQPQKVETPSETTEPAIQNQALLNAELAIYEQAIFALSENKLDEAEKLFLTMSEKQPDFAGTWANLALIDIKKEQFDSAQSHINTALEKNPDMPQALNIAGKLALQKDQLEKAKTYFQAAIKAKPDYALAHYNLALIYDIYFQDIINAIPHYERYLENTDQEDPDTERWLKGLKSTIKASQS